MALLLSFEQLDDPDDSDPPIAPQTADQVFAAYWS
jgi:hypothetical protein